MNKLDEQIRILDSYKEDLKWSIWHLEAAKNITDKQRKINTLKEIVKDISNEVVVLKGKRWKMNESKNQEN